MSITIPARDLRPEGDVLSVGGVQFAVKAWEHPCNRANVLGYFFLDGEQVGSISIPGNVFIEVDRPDPDVDLVEAMAEAIWLSDQAPFPWLRALSDSRKPYLDNARAALDAVRSAGRLS